MTYLRPFRFGAARLTFRAPFIGSSFNISQHDMDPHVTVHVIEHRLLVRFQELCLHFPVAIGNQRWSLRECLKALSCLGLPIFSKASTK